ncbi:MAG: ATP-binding cassette domain-containing protein, partial [Tannerellaceae bacterium]|nr:ATP-binding cassette domain-containing protein [Tannerellaceae bacterium]
HKRGSGDSIWEIKKRIVYVSPEMHMYYMENVPLLHIVGSGFFDSVGLYRKCNEEQERVALQWMETFGIAHLKDRLFLTLSSGEQRLGLLARAFVKSPDLLVLDEPLHGLDIRNKQKVIGLIEQYCSLPGKTLIYVTHYLQELPPCIDKRFELTKHT